MRDEQVRNVTSQLQTAQQRIHQLETNATKQHGQDQNQGVSMEQGILDDLTHVAQHNHQQTKGSSELLFLGHGYLIFMHVSM